MRSFEEGRREVDDGVQVMSFADWDNSYLQSTFPQDIDVLTIHGDADDVRVSFFALVETILTSPRPQVVPLEGSSIPFSYDSRTDIICRCPHISQDFLPASRILNSHHRSR